MVNSGLPTNLCKLCVSRPQVTKAAEPKEICFDQVSRKRMQDGINKLADAVAVTLGPRGENEQQTLLPKHINPTRLSAPKQLSLAVG